MNILNIAAPSTLPHPGEHAPVERFATVVISPRIQVQGVLIWQEGAHACVETSPDRQFTGRVANMAQATGPVIATRLWPPDSGRQECFRVRGPEQITGAIGALEMLALQGHDGALGHDVAQLGEAIAAIEASTVWFVCR